jgi:hypothetical protein
MVTVASAVFNLALEPALQEFVPQPNWSAEARSISVAHYTKSFVQGSGYKALSMLVINRAKR